MSMTWDEKFGSDWNDEPVPTFGTIDDLVNDLDLEKLTVYAEDTTSQQLDPSTDSPTSVAAFYEWRGNHKLPPHGLSPSNYLFIPSMDDDFMPPIDEQVTNDLDTTPSHDTFLETHVPLRPRTESDGKHATDDLDTKSFDDIFTERHAPLRPRTESDSSVSNSACSWSSSPEPTKKIYICVEEIDDTDVLFGRGSRSNSHPGNETYRRRILVEQPVYKSLTDKGKKLLSEEIVEWVKQVQGGRFLALDRTPGGRGRYYLAMDKKAREKVSQALREDHTPEGRALKKSRQRGCKSPMNCNAPKAHHADRPRR